MAEHGTVLRADSVTVDREQVRRDAESITGVWLRGGENEMVVLVEIDGEWVECIREFVPTHGNDGSVWPISHIKEMP